MSSPQLNIKAPTRHWGLFIILAIYLALTLTHSIIVPITQGEDELAHYRYIKFIAENGRLPINAEEREEAWYRSDWPALYHLLVGAAVSGLDTTQPVLKDVGEHPKRRLVGEIFYPRLIIYTEDARWLWEDGIRAWHIGRFISIGLTTLALIVTYYTALAFFQNLNLTGFENPSGFKMARQFALLTTSILAFIPRFVFTSSMLGDDSLFILFSSLMIWLLFKMIRGQDSWWLYVGLGILFGLSISTKYSTGLFPFIILLVIWWRKRQVGWTWLESGQRLAVNWLCTVLGTSWWFGWIMYHFNTIKTDGLIFGLLHPLLASGPDVSMRRIFAFFTGQAFTGQARPDAISEGTWFGWITYLIQTFWSVPVLEVDPLGTFYHVVIFLTWLIATYHVWRFWRTAPPQTRTEISLLVGIIILLIPFPILRFYLTYNVLETGQGRHILYPAAQAFPILITLGILVPTQERGNKAVILWSLPALLLLGTGWQLNVMLNSYPPPLTVQTSTFATSQISQPVAHAFGNDIKLLGYDLTYQPADLSLKLYWRANGTVDENYRTLIELIDSEQTVQLRWISHPLNGRYPTRAWDAGDVVRDELLLPIGNLPDGEYQVQVSWLGQADSQRLAGQTLSLTKIRLDVPRPDRFSKPVRSTFRQRQTIGITWTDEEHDDWHIRGPNDIIRTPLTYTNLNAIFIVESNWLSGDYQLIHNGQQRGDPFTINTDPRTFALPADLPPSWTPVEANFADQVKLLGYSLPTRRTDPGGGLPITLYWQSIAPVLGDYVTFNKLLSAEQEVFGGYDRLPREFYSTILWADGEVVEDGVSLPVRPDAPDGVYHLHVGLYELDDNDQPISLPLVQDGQTLEASSVVIGPLKVGGPPAGITIDTPQPSYPLNQNIGWPVPELDPAWPITLLGYDLNNCSELTGVENGETLEPTCEVTLYWHAHHQLSRDYTTFVHLRDEANQTVAQKDGPPAQGRYPTRLWDAGEVVVDQITLSVQDLPSNTYRPVVGLYDSLTGERLPVEGRPENEIQLEPFERP